jgi:NAD(P)H dehydrogenase (quinone)
MIVVTGATGKLGSAVVGALLERVPAAQVAASVRDPGKARALAQRGVDVRSGDFGAPATLAGAFAGAGQVLVVSVDRFGEAARTMHRAAFEAARAAGARRVLYTSHMGARPDAVFADHDAAEAALADLGIAFTSLRHGFYAESALHLIGRGLETGDIRVPEDGPVAWTARADLAEADAILLADEGRLDGITPPLAALDAFTMADLAAIASELTGRTIRHTVVPDTQWRDEQLAAGLPAPMADALLGMYRSARRGDLATDDDTLARLLGRRPRTLRDVLAETLTPAPAASAGLS